MATGSQRQPSSDRARFQDIELAHAKADGSAEQPDQPDQPDHLHRPGSPPSASGFSWTIGKKKTRSSKVLEALENIDADKDQIVLSSVLRLPDLVGLTASRSHHKPSRTAAARSSGFSVSMPEDSLPDVAGQPGIHAATHQRSSITEHPRSNWITTPSPHPSRSPMRMPSTPRKPLYSYTQANSRADESQAFDAAWTDVEDEAVEQDSGFVEFGSSDCNQNCTFWDLSSALSKQEATDSKNFTERQLSNFPPECSISGSPATSLAILDFSSPLPPLTRSAVHKPPARHVSPDFSHFSHSDHAYNQPDLDSHSFVDALVQYEDNPENTDFGRNSSHKSCFISDKSYDKFITLGTFLDDPDPWNAIGRFLNLAPLIHNNNHSSVSSNSRAGVGWSSSCSVSSNDNSGDNSEYGMDVESQGSSPLSPALSASSLTMAIDAILSRSCSPALPEHSPPSVWLEPSRPDSPPSSAMLLSASGSSQSFSKLVIDQSQVNAVLRSTGFDVPELQPHMPSPTPSVCAVDPDDETPTAIEPFSATIEHSNATEDTKSDVIDPPREPEALCLFADGVLEAEESDEEGFM